MQVELNTIQSCVEFGMRRFGGNEGSFVIIVILTCSRKAYLCLLELEVSMGSRNSCICPANKTVAFVQILCSLALFLLPLLSDAKTFVFKPTTQPAYYSDTANWVNRDYPGRQIVFGDTIAFEINAGFHEVIIDSNLFLEGNCHIGAGLHWTVPPTITLTFMGVSNDPVGLWMDRVRLFADTASLVSIEGRLYFYGVGAKSHGNVNISGSIWADADVSPSGAYSQYLIFNKASISGSCGGIGLVLSCKSLFVDTSAIIFIYSGYTWNGGSLNGDSVLNKGKISLREETGMDCSYMYNEGQINAGFLSGKLNNTGAIEIVQKPINSFTANLWDVVNSGSVSLSGSIYSPISINGVHNTGTFYVSDYLGVTSTLPWLKMNGIIYNSNQWIQDGSMSNAEMNGSYTNTDTFDVRGKIDFNGGTFTNNGTFSFNIPPYDFPLFRIRNHFVNNAIFTGFGALEISGQFDNYGSILLRSPLFPYQKMLIIGDFYNYGSVSISNK